MLGIPEEFWYPLWKANAGLTLPRIYSSKEVDFVGSTPFWIYFSLDRDGVFNACATAMNDRISQGRGKLVVEKFDLLHPEGDLWLLWLKRQPTCLQEWN